MEYRCEAAADIPQIHAVVAAAFHRPDEAYLVDALRTAGELMLSVVAEQDGQVVGHAAFSHVRVGETLVRALGLGPLAVLPEFQKQGVGTGLVKHGLRWSDELGVDAVFVLGDPAYYGRFGFRPASAWEIRWEHPALEEHFQALELRPGALEGRAGVVRYAEAFNEL